MSKSTKRCKSRKIQRNRLSSTKRKQQLENANVGESQYKGIPSFEKAKKVLDMGIKGRQNDLNSSQSSGIRSPHFYKPKNKKLFYIPKTNKLLTNVMSSTEKSMNNSWVKETSNSRIRNRL